MNIDSVNAPRADSMDVDGQDAAEKLAGRDAVEVSGRLFCVCTSLFTPTFCDFRRPHLLASQRLTPCSESGLMRTRRWTSRAKRCVDCAV